MAADPDFAVPTSIDEAKSLIRRNKKAATRLQDEIDQLSRGGHSTSFPEHARRDLESRLAWTARAQDHFQAYLDRHAPAKRKTGKQLDAEIEAAIADAEAMPTAAEVEAALTKVQALVQYLRHNAIGYDEEGEKTEARKFRKLADQIDAALLAHDLTQLRKLTRSKALLPEEQLPERDLEPLSFGWGKR